MSATFRLQPMDLTSLRAVLAEWRPLLLPSRFEKAQQGEGQTVQLALRHLHGLQWLELSWQAEAARVLAIDPPPRQGEGSTLAQQLQHGLRGLALTAIEQPGWERVVRLVFARRPGDPPERCLVIELMGRRSNLFLLDAEGRVIAIARQVKPGQSRLRPIGSGDPYQPPPPLPGRLPDRTESFLSWRQQVQLLPLPLEQALRDSYQGVSPALCRQLAPSAWLVQPVDRLSPDQWEQLWSAWQGWLEALAQQRFLWRVDQDGYCCWQSGCGPSGTPCEAEAGQPLPINRALSRYVNTHLQRRRLLELRQQLQQQLQRQAEREAQQAAEQQRLLEAATGSAALQRQADALLCQRQPSRSCIDTAQKLYRQARKLRRSVEAITPRLALHRERGLAIEASLTYLDQAGSPAELEAIRQELEELLGPGGRQGRRSRRAVEPPPGQPIPLEVRTGRGLLLQVGRNHRQNEWISFRQARRGDLWFHAQELPGSHVVLKSSAMQAEAADLQAAADLAAHFSRGRANGRVPVVMVPTDELQRIPGAAAGTVRHRGGTVLWGIPEQALSLLPAQHP
ncbi:MAG: NFACT RNA binding domain-containing protein [Chitinophagaceae bacterium]|nr:NFACT RNA binding domain-containing protein [Chitinophagaceae bacterium]